MNLPDRAYLVLSLAIFAISAGSLHAADEFRIDGWREAVFSVSDTGQWVDTLTEVGGWQVIHEGDFSREWLDAYRLVSNVSAREVLMANPGTDTGLVRLVQFEGVPQRHIRSNGQTWETGGIYDVNVRVIDLPEKFQALQSRDWHGVADPMDLVFDQFVVAEWLAYGPDGIVFALIQRKQPPLEGWPNLKHFSRLFNSTQIVADMDRALEFYVDTLGFQIYIETDGPSETPGPNVLGLPHNLADKISRHVYIVHPGGGNTGSVELIAFDGASGRDFSEHAHPPNLGIISLRFPVSGIQQLAERLAKRNVEIVSALRSMEFTPEGPTQHMIVRGPNGEWLEFFEPEK